MLCSVRRVELRGESQLVSANTSTRHATCSAAHVEKKQVAATRYFFTRTKSAADTATG